MANEHADIYLKMDPIKGESLDEKGYKDAVVVLSWSLGASNPGSHGIGTTGGATGRTQFTDLSLTKYVDKSTPDLLKALCEHKHFDKALLVCRKAGASPIEYLKITLDKVVIASIQHGGHGGDSQATENVSLNFQKLKMEYIQQTPDGKEGAKPKFGWDIAGHKEW